jgi:MFS family permease
MEGLTMSSSVTAGTSRPSTDSSPAGSTFQGWLLLCISCLPVLGAVLLAPVLPAIAREFAGNPAAGTLVPMIITAPALVIAAGSPFVGYLTDKIGRKNALIVSLVAYSLAGTAPLWLDSLEGIVASRFLLGACEAVIMTACTTLLGDYFSGQRRAHFLSLLTVLTTVSATVFLVVGGIMGTVGWQAPFWLYASGIVLAVVAARRLHEPLVQPARRVLANVPWGRLVVPLLFTFIGGAAFFALIVHLPFILEGLGVTDAGQVGLLSAVASAATAAGAFSYRLMGRLSPAAMLTVSFGMSGLGFLLVWASGDLALTMVGAVIASAGTGLSVPTLLIWTIGRLEQEVRGTGTGIWTSVNWLGQFASPIIVGAFAATAGGLSSGIGYLGILVLVLAAGWLLSVLLGVYPFRRADDPAGANPS